MPGIIVFASVVAAISLIEVDGRLDDKAFESWPRLFGAGAEGARGLLATVASSMVTVAGVVFSITIVALSLASSQYTSRVLRNFMRDQVNQVVLGVFVGIFAYCLVVLRTIRGGDEGSFVPSLAVLGGLLLAFVGIAVLIYFIHHISISIQAVNILSSITHETLHAIEHLFPENVGEPEVATSVEDESSSDQWREIPAIGTGYIQSIDTTGFLKFAEENDAVIRMEKSIGEFVIEGISWAAIRSDSAIEDEVVKGLNPLYSVGSSRTVEQDAGFGIRQIVDVALKALSPGINDTTTAVMCINDLTAILVRLTDRRIESRFRSKDGHLRLITQRPTYASFVGESYNQIRENAAGNVAVLESLLGSVELLVRHERGAARRKVLADQTQVMLDLAHTSISVGFDLQRIDATAARIQEMLQES